MDDRASREWSEEAPRYKQRWERAGGGAQWEEVEPGYRVGWELSRNEKYRGRKWTEVEPEFRRSWSERYPDKPWDRFLDRAQEIWDEMTLEPGASPKAGDPRGHDESSGR